MILLYIVLITGFRNKSDTNGIKTFEFSLSEKRSNDQDIQSAHKDIQNYFKLFFCIILNKSLNKINLFSLFLRSSIEDLFGNGLLFKLTINMLFLKL